MLMLYESPPRWRSVKRRSPLRMTTYGRRWRSSLTVDSDTAPAGSSKKKGSQARSRIHACTICMKLRSRRGT
eukprot:scaffold7878_cov126-Isochrysis_galbana.AAC.10